MWRRSRSCQKPGNHPWHLPLSCPPESNQLPDCVIDLPPNVCFSPSSLVLLGLPSASFLIRNIFTILFPLSDHSDLFNCSPVSYTPSLPPQLPPLPSLYFNLWSKRTFKNASLTWKFSISKHISSSQILLKSRIFHSLEDPACLCNSFFSSHVGLSHPWTNLWSSFSAWELCACGSLLHLALLASLAPNEFLLVSHVSSSISFSH